MSKPNQTCGTCRWWGNSSGGTKRECRKHPPVVIATGRVHNPFGASMSGIETEWPMVGSMAYCGEWEASTSHKDAEFHKEMRLRHEAGIAQQEAQQELRDKVKPKKRGRLRRLLEWVFVPSCTYGIPSINDTPPMPKCKPPKEG